MKAALLSFFIVGCSALNVKSTVKRDSPNAKKDQEISNKPYKKNDLVQVIKDHSTGPMVANITDDPEKLIEMWFVNMKQSKDRRTCMERQIQDMSLKPHVFNGINFHQCLTYKDPKLTILWYRRITLSQMLAATSVPWKPC